MTTISAELLSKIKPVFHPAASSDASSASVTIQKTIDSLHLIPHIEGGYFVETDRDPLRIPNPFRSESLRETTAAPSAKDDDSTRSASTSIFYLITPQSPMGAFHRNSGRTVHTLHRGRGRYVIIHADEVDSNLKKARIETFVVGHDISRGEKLQWIVEGGKYKASYLLPDDDDDEIPKSDGLLISEVGWFRY